MRIDNLPPLTKLMWDPNAKSPVTNDPIIYPALVLDKHPDRPWVRIATGHNTNWMGPVESNLRKPTASELKDYVWPNPPKKS